MSRKIYINGRFLTRKITGVERTAYELVKALDQMLSSSKIPPEKFEFILIYSGTLINDIALNHISLLQKGKLKGNLWEQLELPLYTAGHLLISLCTVSTLFKRRQFVMIHDAAFMAKPHFFPEKVRRWYEFTSRVLGSKIRRILTVSQFSKAELVRYFNFKEEQISVIPNAGEHILAFSEASSGFKAKVSAAKPFILAVSSQSANKNFSALGRAIKEIDFNGYQLLIAGGVISTLKQSTTGYSVTMLGYVSDAELKYLYSQAELFVFPSFYEGFGIPPLEAMISGCPVLCSNTSSLPEVLGSACEYFDPANSKELADKLQELTRDPKRRSELKTMGFERAALYNWQKSANQLFKLIEEYGN